MESTQEISEGRGKRLCSVKEIGEILLKGKEGNPGLDML
jgi:hypothetical protein